MTSKEIVDRAVEMRKPPRVPVYFFYKDIEQSDIVFTCISKPDGLRDENPLKSEWGFVWEKLDDTMGQPKNHLLETWDRFKDYEPPYADVPGRFRGIDEFRERYADKYIMGGCGITGFNLDHIY